jgi:hypothetical protein
MDSAIVVCDYVEILLLYAPGKARSLLVGLLPLGRIPDRAIAEFDLRKAWTKRPTGVFERIHRSVCDYAWVGSTSTEGSLDVTKDDDTREILLRGPGNIRLFPIKCGNFNFTFMYIYYLILSSRFARRSTINLCVRSSGGYVDTTGLRGYLSHLEHHARFSTLTPAPLPSHYNSPSSTARSVFAPSPGTQVFRVSTHQGRRLLWLEAGNYSCSRHSECSRY